MTSQVCQCHTCSTEGVREDLCWICIDQRGEGNVVVEVENEDHGYDSDTDAGALRSQELFEVRETGVDVAASVMKGANGKVSVLCKIVNAGSRAGKFVVQFYVKAPTPSGFQSLSFHNRNTGSNSARPVEEFKEFEKVQLQLGESKAVAAELDRYAVSYYDEQNTCWRAVRGIQTALVGFSVREIVGEADFLVEDDFTWNGI